MKKVNITKLIHHPVMLLILVIGIAIFTTSCDDLFGLDRYNSYDYVPGSIDPHVDQTAMQFMESRQDSGFFSIMKDAIEYTDMRSAYEGDNDYTFILIKDVGFRNPEPKFNNSGYLKDQFNKLYNYKVSLLDTADTDYDAKVLVLQVERDQLIIDGTIRDVPVDSVSMLVNYHIMKTNVGGSWSWIERQEYWSETLLFDTKPEKGMMSIERDSRWRLYINDFDGSARKTSVSQQGIIPTNGLIEVTSSYAEYQEK
jgi:hypothetical protein